MQTSQSEQKPLDNTAKKSCWLMAVCLRTLWLLVSVNVVLFCFCFVLALACHFDYYSSLPFPFKGVKGFCSWLIPFNKGRTFTPICMSSSQQLSSNTFSNTTNVQVSKSSQKGNFNIHDRSLSHHASLILSCKKLEIECFIYRITKLRALLSENLWKYWF